MTTADQPNCCACCDAPAEYVLTDPTDASAPRGTLFCGDCSAATSAGFEPIVADTYTSVAAAMRPQVISTTIRPGVTDVRTIGQHEAVTDHTRVLEDGRHCGYAVQYSSPIGPELPAKSQPKESADMTIHPNDADHMSALGRRIAVRMDAVASGDRGMASAVAHDLRNAIHVVLPQMTTQERQQLSEMISAHLLPTL
jgi:hypothetical protein